MSNEQFTKDYSRYGRSFQVHSINDVCGINDCTFDEIRTKLEDAEKEFEKHMKPEYKGYYRMTYERCSSYYDSIEDIFNLNRLETEDEYRKRI